MAVAMVVAMVAVAAGVLNLAEFVRPVSLCVPILHDLCRIGTCYVDTFISLTHLLC